MDDTEFHEGQWWLKELDGMVEFGTPNQKRAVAVVRNMMRQLAACEPVYQVMYLGLDGGGWVDVNRETMESSSFREILTLERDVAEFLARHAQDVAGELNSLAHLVSIIDGADAADMTIAEAILAAGYRISSPAAAHGDEAVRKDAERYRWVREPSSGNKVWAMITDGECGRNMDATIDAAMCVEADQQETQPYTSDLVYQYLDSCGFWIEAQEHFYQYLKGQGYTVRILQVVE